MYKSTISAAAIALVLNPVGVSAEILSQARLNEIRMSKAPGPVEVETLRSRDRDLLIALGTTLREKYGSVLTGSEIVFTRTERAGRIVYRMDFLNVKTQDHAEGICQILEMEDCVILHKDGSANLISAEVDQDGLLSLDEYVPFSGVVRMDKIPSKADVRKSSRVSMNLPGARPVEATTVAAPMVDPQDHADIVDVAGDEAENQPDLEMEAPPAPSVPDAGGLSSNGLDVTPKIEVARSARPAVKVMSAPILHADVRDETPSADTRAGVRVKEPSVSMTYDAPDAKQQGNYLEVASLPKSRPGPLLLSSVMKMDLPRARPGVSQLIDLAAMSLPSTRPVSNFGLKDHLPIPRADMLRVASGEVVEEVSLIADLSGHVLMPQRAGGYSVIQSSDEIAKSLENFSLEEDSKIKISIPGSGSVVVPENIPSVSVAMDKTALQTRVQEGNSGLEMEIEGIDRQEAETLPRVFVLSFAEDGVKAFPNARVEPAKPDFKIATVVMTDAFSTPFDVRGDGEPDLQKIPKSRPDMSMFDSDIALVSARNANVLLGELLSDPVQVAQVPVRPGASEDEVGAEENPGDILMRRLSGMVDDEDDFKGSDLNLALEPSTKAFSEEKDTSIQEAAEISSQVVEDKPSAQIVETSPKKVVNEELPRAADGLVDLEAMSRAEETKKRALSVLGEIASSSEAEAVLQAAPQQRAPKPVMPTLVQPTAKATAQVPDSRGIFDVAGRKTQKEEVQSNPGLRIELSYATSRDDVARRAKELEAYIPAVIMAKGRFYGLRAPTNPETYIIGIEARDAASRDAIVWYLEKMMIPWAIRGQVK